MRSAISNRPMIQGCQRLLRSTHRCFSASSDLVSVNINEEKGIATLSMKRPPVNSLSLEMCQAISKSIKDIEGAGPNIQAMVLGSSLPSILSAGLDLTEMVQPDPQRLPQFWDAFQQLFIDLYGSRLAVMAAIEGHAPAAGCMLAMACDYRIMAASEGSWSPIIGMNGSRFGMLAPFWFVELAIQTIGHREGEKALALGTLYTSEEALEKGLVDEVLPKESVFPRAEEEAAKWARIPAHARAAGKSLTRRALVEKLKAMREADNKTFVSFVTQDIMQKGLMKYIEKLKAEGG